MKRIFPAVRSLFLAAAVITLAVLAMPATSSAQVSIGIGIRIGPPALPIYEQPLCPGEGYIWTPGYWAYDYDAADYYWVPGTWVLAPQPGFLWTPGYWGWSGAAFVFHEGYWGPHVGFYGGINYGFGYIGVGYQGGRWDNGRFFYNRAVNNVNVTNVHNVYNTTVINQTTVNRISYNGGNGGITARPTAAEEEAVRDKHIQRVAVQAQHEQAARVDREQRASVNQGKPAVAATPKPAELRDRAAVPAKEAGAPYHPPANQQGGRAENNVPRPNNDNNVPRPGAENNNVPRPKTVHPNDLPARERPTAPNTGNAKLDKKYEQREDKLGAKQDQERQRLQQKQEQEHQKMTQQRANEAKQQQTEQRHEQQTQKLEQKQAQQQQRLQEKQKPAGGNQPKPSEPR